VIPVRALANRAMDEFLEIQRELLAQVQRGEITMVEARENIEHFWAGRLRRAVVHGDVEEGSVMAGQTVGLVTAEQPISEIFDELIEQALTVLSRENGRPDSN
jgi:enoyl-[acyl-carrier protein] reductase II